MQTLESFLGVVTTMGFRETDIVTTESGAEVALTRDVDETSYALVKLDMEMHEGDILKILFVTMLRIPTAQANEHNSALTTPGEFTAHVNEDSRVVGSYVAVVEGLNTDGVVRLMAGIAISLNRTAYLFSKG